MRSTIPVGLEQTLKLSAIVALFVLFGLLLSVEATLGDLNLVTAQSTADTEGADTDFEWEMAEDDDAVTMSFDVEDVERIDLGMARGDIVIDTWKGNDVLVVVERLAKSRSNSGVAVGPRPVRFRVSRLGNNVTITPLHERGPQIRETDVSFRIIVPTERQDARVRDVYDLSKLASVVFGAVQREALRWIMR